MSSSLNSSNTFTGESFFSIRGDLDGEQLDEFKDLEQLIGVIISDDEFLLPINEVAEILMLPPITYVPRSPEYIEGVINLRGTIIPTVNARKLAGYPKGKASPNTRIIIIKANDQKLGLIVDGITFVQSLQPEEIEQKSLPLHNSNVEILTRIAKKGQRIQGILNVEKIVNIITEPKDAD